MRGWSAALKRAALVQRTQGISGPPKSKAAVARRGIGTIVAELCPESTVSFARLYPASMKCDP